MPSLKVISLGCSKNTVDSEVILGNIKAAGWSVISENSQRTADVVLINTCGFILDAKQESIDTVLLELERKHRRKKGKLIVMGCLVQRHGQELEKEIPGVDYWIGVNDSQKVVDTILSCFPDNRCHIEHQSRISDKSISGEEIGMETADTDSKGSEVDYTVRKLTTPSHYAYIKVSEGCNRQCAFCAIPLIRGKHISRPKEEILEEARKLVRKGVKELILVAQDLTFYGMDIYGRREIAALVRDLCQIRKLEWVRLQYLYPHSFPDDLLEVMKSEPKVCKYVDIPLQHINTGVLKSMLRSTTRDESLALLEKFRKALPDAAFRTTMIVGFPTEGEAEFRELKEFVADFRFDRLGVFPYSLEEGTPAFGMGDTVSAEEKERRAQEIMDLQEEISLSCNQARVGKIYKVLIDREEGEFYVGRTEYDSPEVDNEVLIPVDTAVLVPGEFYQVKIVSAEPFDLYGRVVEAI